MQSFRKQQIQVSSLPDCVSFLFFYASNMSNMATLSSLFMTYFISPPPSSFLPRYLYHICASRDHSSHSSVRGADMQINEGARSCALFVHPIGAAVSREWRWRLHSASGAVHGPSHLARPQVRAQSFSTWTTLSWRPEERTVRLAAR